MTGFLDVVHDSVVWLLWIWLAGMITCVIWIGRLWWVRKPETPDALKPSDREYPL